MVKEERAMRRYRISRPVFNDTFQYLKNLGKEGVEGTVLWGGYTHDENCYAMTAYNPELCPEKLFKKDVITEERLERMERDILSKFREELSRRGQTCVAVVRSFPPGVSDEDIRYVREGIAGYFELNTLFVIVPNYALAPLEFAQLDKYRLVEEDRLITVLEISETMPIRTWKRLKSGEIMFEIVDHIAIL